MNTIESTSIPPVIGEGLQGSIKLMRMTALPPRSWPGLDNDPFLLSLINHADLVLIDSWTPNAFASYTSNRRYVIGVNAGLICAIADAIMLSLEVPAVADELPIMSRPIIINRSHHTLFIDYSFVPGLPANATMANIVCSVPEGDRQRLAGWLIDFALAWVSLHERAHILLGHLELDSAEAGGVSEYWERPESETEKDSESLMRRQALELQADAFATKELCTRNTQESIWGEYKLEVLSTPSGVYRFSAYAIGIVMQVMKKAEDYFGLGATHPPTDIRLLSSVLKMPTEDNRPCRGASYGMRECMALAAQHPTLLPSFPMVVADDPRPHFEALAEQLAPLTSLLRDFEADLRRARKRLAERLGVV